MRSSSSETVLRLCYCFRLARACPNSCFLNIIFWFCIIFKPNFVSTQRQISRVRLCPKKCSGHPKLRALDRFGVIAGSNLSNLYAKLFPKLYKIDTFISIPIIRASQAVWNSNFEFRLELVPFAEWFGLVRVTATKLPDEIHFRRQPDSINSTI